VLSESHLPTLSDPTGRTNSSAACPSAISIPRDTSAWTVPDWAYAKEDGAFGNGFDGPMGVYGALSEANIIDVDLEPKGGDGPTSSRLLSDFDCGTEDDAAVATNPIRARLPPSELPYIRRVLALSSYQTSILHFFSLLSGTSRSCAFPWSSIVTETRESRTRLSLSCGSVAR
jgi:hypothetical protein